MMKKKRLLALALCLVLAVSLLPITAAAAEETRVFKSVDMQGQVNVDEYQQYYVDVSNVTIRYNDKTISDTGFPTLGITTSQNSDQPITTPPKEGETYYSKFMYRFDYERFGVAWSDPFSANLEIPGYKAELIWKGDNYTSDRYPELWFIFRLTKEHEHTWQFTQTEKTLTVTCQNCDTPPVTLSLSAHSVTLPDSPFNARLEGKEQFETATGAAISKIRYDYKGSDGVWHKDVDPIAANAKAGEYQAFVQISNLPRPVESDGVVAMAENPDGIYTADLYVKYTAADPAITAQTGDDRPIEIMLVSALAFTALAAAAFLLDNKRKYSR